MEDTIDYESIFAPFGGRLQQNRADKWWEVDCGELVLSIHPAFNRIRKGFRIATDCSIFHKGLSAMATRILGDPSAGQCRIKWEQCLLEIISLQEAEAEYRKLIVEEIEQVRTLNILALIKNFAANCPDKPSCPQIMHLASLAWLGDFNTLGDYQNIFKGGHRMNFLPIITKAAIDHALDIAIERASENSGAERKC